MNLSASQCGSGCESGWTFYLNQSFCSQTWSDCEFRVNGVRLVGEVEDEGLSMASSGPRQYYCLEKQQKHNVVIINNILVLMTLPEEASIELDFSQGV
ncbi:hypothetical protein V6N13_054167 [Hibiscus sabdariffa]|uniref:Uncharacterized protein n=1 Tax=Hibiscus sabdariffa TaxID=183260 RepID=A0ABR2DYN2_9ROSI